MARITSIQHFASVADIKQTFGTTLPKPHDWRLLTEPASGCINGLPTTQGIAIATNGILVAIIQQDKLIIGHNDFFVADEQESTTSVTKRSSPLITKSSTRRQPVDVSEFI